MSKNCQSHHVLSLQLGCNCDWNCWKASFKLFVRARNTTSYLHTCCKCDYRWKSHSTHIPMLINGCKRCRLWLFEDLKVKAKGTLNTTICIYNETKSEKLIAGIVVAASEVVHLPTCTCKLSCNERNNRLTRVSSSSLWSNYWMNEQDDVWS